MISNILQKCTKVVVEFNAIKFRSIINTIPDEELVEIIKEIKNLEHYKDTTVGLMATDIDIYKLFDKAMHYKSDSNPFEEGGDCVVENGYMHTKMSISKYLDTVFFKLTY